MRFLKNKVFNNPQKNPSKKESSPLQMPTSLNNNSSGDRHPGVNSKPIAKQDSPSNQRNRANGEFVTPYSVRCTKNIVKNYGRAMCTFATSSMAKPYVEDIIKKHNFDLKLEEFYQFVEANKEVVDSIERLKNMMIVTPEDKPAIALSKQLFRLVGEVFIKYFSVNWIFSSKIMHKQPHLQFRFKLLRRLRNPELFTYLKPFSKR